jgi:D-arabinose 5-phosphate isomerase GutQ
MSVQPDLRVLSSSEAILNRGAEVIEAEARALELLAKSLEDSFVEACATILACGGRVIFT